MAYPAKEKRNKEIIRLRTKDPVKWSFGEIAKEFNIKKQTAHAIFVREQAKKLETVENS